MTIHNLSKEYFENLSQTTKLRTALTYEGLYNRHLKSHFENWPENTEMKALEKLLLEKSKTLSQSTIKMLHSIILGIFQFAGKPIDLPFPKTPAHKAKPKQVEALTIHEQQKLEKHILSKQDFYHYGIIFALYTGLRIGELLALTWEDVDLIEKTIFVNKTVFSATDLTGKTQMFVDTPKSASSIRIVAIPTKLVPLFRALKKDQNGQSSFVVSRKSGKQIKVRVYQASFAKLLKKLKIRHYGFHSLRHTFATRAVESGVDIKTLSEVLGHSSIHITLRTYVHSSFKQKQALANKLAKNLKF